MVVEVIEEGYDLILVAVLNVHDDLVGAKITITFSPFGSVEGGREGERKEGGSVENDKAFVKVPSYSPSFLPPYSPSFLHTFIPSRDHS